MKTMIAVVCLAAAVAAVLVARAFRKDEQAAEQRVTGRSELMQTSFGPLDYASAGSGSPVLMIHGTGGGFDQALTFTEALLPHGHRVIAPSRFGHLRSGFPADPSSEHQADALLQLLDALRIGRVPVVGGSAGALSAVQFALRHPERTSALILGATPSERRRADRILDEIMPVARRSRGMLNGASLAGSPARVDFSRITVPTLVISVADDRFGTAATARDMAAAVPGARLVIYPQGGHIWVGHDEAVWQEVSRFIARNAPRPPAPAGP